jgi:hypothetical protein
MAKGYPGDKRVISGIRDNCQAFIDLNLGKLMADKYVVHESVNGVILTSGNETGFISPHYFRRIINKKGMSLYSAKFDYFVAFDIRVNSNPDRNESTDIEEVIQIPAVIIDYKNKRIEKVFNAIVKPEINSTLSKS